jgi:DNA-binding transcriptional regulator YhcF (GntR family)
MPWEFRGDAPIYAQLTDQFRRRIVSGDLPPGSRLPSVRDLAAEAGVNPNTMQRAMAEMERLGLVFSQRTAGRFVTEDETVIRDQRRDLAREQIRSFLAGMEQLGFDRAEIAALLEEEGERT